MKTFSVINWKSYEYKSCSWRRQWCKVFRPVLTKWFDKLKSLALPTSSWYKLSFAVQFLTHLRLMNGKIQLQVPKMRNSRKTKPTKSTGDKNGETGRANQNQGQHNNVASSPYMVTATLILPVACVAIFYVINQPLPIKPSINSHSTYPLSAEVSGWQRASVEEEKKFNTNFCTIERRNASSLTSEEFEQVYRYRKPLIVHFNNGAADWTDPMKWTKASLRKLYSQWSILSGTSEDIVRRGGNGDTETSFDEYLEIMHRKKHNDEPM